MLLNAHFITYIAVVFATNITIIFALGAIMVGWWHLFCPRHFINLFAYVAIVTMALTLGTVEIDR